MKRSILSFFALLLCMYAVAQDSAKRRFNGPAMSLFADSGKLSTGDYMLHLEEVYQLVDRVQAASELRFEIINIKREIDENDTALKTVSESLNVYASTLNIRNLQTYRILLHSITADLDRHQGEIDTASVRMERLKKEMLSLRKDTLLRQLMRDSALRATFSPQLKDLRKKLRFTDSTLHNSITYVNQLKLHASFCAITASELTNKVNGQLTRLSVRAFGKEYGYLWEIDADTSSPALEKQLRKSYKGEKRALDYYLADAGMNRLLLILFAVAFFWWLRRNLRRMKRMNAMDELDNHGIVYIIKQPLASTFAFMLCMAPLFDLDAPAGYVGFIQFLLLIALTFLFRKQWPRTLFYYWLGVVGLFILYSFSGLAAVPSFGQRIWIIILNLLSVGLWLLFYFRVTEQVPLKRFVKMVLIINIILNLLAVTCNLFGRLTLSQIFSTAAIFTFTQAIALSACYRIFTESLLLQVTCSRLEKDIRNPFDAKEVIEGFRKMVLMMAVFIWLIVFTTNLSIYNSIYNGLSKLLATQRTIGSISFSLGSVVLFFIIIWVAHMLQRYISYFFGDVNDEEEGVKGSRSKLVITRLIVLAGGYLLAVAASGLPVDKITIVLGALGVGIGMGLQNIVNNFVSGIILIFDRPLQIGDAIEVGDTAGRVKEIGLRSSTIYTEDGAEVIIPNGDILSQQITNWTLSNNNRRVELDLSVATDMQKDELSALLKTTILSSEQVLRKREPLVLIESVTEGEYGLKIYFWCTDVQKSDWIRSEVRYLVYTVLREKNVVVK
ncbi:mechanosensitive ion channel domain-containing protein [uncultured Chitinophaga sp.]|uniref:mechanosensitive ion channel family protein n=1 Tax=uncultured Chitinophaga sp. TaxID=339340 RepID=UPI0025E7083B|nr:mechanosensitive ion channel domain-containing protein [uncultured Chitinophaga sp.]